MMNVVSPSGPLNGRSWSASMYAPFVIIPSVIPFVELNSAVAVSGK